METIFLSWPAESPKVVVGDGFFNSPKAPINKPRYFQFSSMSSIAVEVYGELDWLENSDITFKKEDDLNAATISDLENVSISGFDYLKFPIFLGTSGDYILTIDDHDIHISCRIYAD